MTDAGTPPGRLPNLIVIGAMKCGTTSLYHYLGSHPEIGMSRTKELNFFVDSGNWERGIDWYASRFPTDAPVRGEASPSYTDYPGRPEAPERMHACVPDAKLVYLVRDPIERMISHYVHSVSEEREDRTLEDALTAPGPNRYRDRSRYWTQLSRYLEHYPRERILVLQSERLAHDRRAALSEVFAFLGVDPEFDSWRFSIRRHDSSRKRRKTRLGRRLERSAAVRTLRRVPNHLRWPLEDALFWPVSRQIRRPALSPETRGLLEEAMATEVERLQQFTGTAFPGWKGLDAGPQTDGG
ncbi:MAG: sulfotransferase [Gemmatimonadota bacterium]